MSKSQRILDLELYDRSIVVKQTSDRCFILTVREWGQHLTMLYRDGRLTMHLTDEHTGERCHLLTFDLARAAKKAEQTDFQNHARKWLMRVWKPVQNPRQLRAQGVGSLLPDLRPIVEPPFNNSRMMNFISSNRMPVEAAWEATPGISYFAFGNGGMKGLVLTGWQKGQQVVYFMHSRKMLELINRLLRELAGPTDQIPWDTIPRLP